MMGQSVGTANVAAIPPVGNIEQFKNRFKVLAKAVCLSPGEADWIKVLSAKFGSEPDQCWSESDLATFLAITLPDELRSDITAAAPLIHRCLRHLGSFPYHISDPSPVLDCETLSVGIVLLLRRREWNLDSLCDDEDSEEWMRRLLFQSLSATNLPTPAAWPSPDARRGPDDEHLLRAHALVSSFNKRRDKSRLMVMHLGPPIIDISQLPPSRSQDVSGSVSSQDFRPLLRLLVASQLFLAGIGPDVVCRDPRKMDAAVDSILGTFTDTATPSSITWESFEPVLKRDTPNLFHGLSRLCGLLVLDGALDHEQIRSLDQAQVVSRLQVAFTSNFNVPGLPVGAVFGPAILAQVSTMIPLDAPLQSPEIMYSSKTDTFQEMELLQHLKANARPMILLVSGSTMKTDSNKNGNDCCYGAFLPQDPEHEAALFQLQPLHHVYGGAVRVIPSPSNAGIQTLQVHIQMADSTEVCLDMGGPGTNGVLSFGRQEKQRFIVAGVDLVGLPPNVHGYELKRDRRFWVGRNKPAQPPNEQLSHGKRLGWVAAASALVLAVQLGPLQVPFLPAGPLADAATDALNMSVTWGTPLFAWQVASAVNTQGPLDAIGVTVATVMASPALTLPLLGKDQSRTGPLWALLGVWWALAALTLSRRQAGVAFGWLKNIVSFRMVVIFLQYWPKFVGTGT